MSAKSIMDKGPAIQPSWAVLHARDKTPAPITPVIICAVAVHMVPSVQAKTIKKINRSRMQ